MMRGLTILMAVLGASCATASGDISGGEETRLDASSPPAFDSGASDGEPSYASAAPDTWTGIYRDLFGRHSPASCAGSGVCHDAAGKLGSQSSNFVCADLDGCYTSLRTALPAIPSDGTRPLVDDASLQSPDGAYLFTVIRYTADDGSMVANRGMPQTPSDYYYSAADIARIKTWMKAGAPNN
jgi:hypothetical protein